jgi:hypothetical protein
MFGSSPTAKMRMVPSFATSIVPAKNPALAAAERARARSAFLNGTERLFLALGVTGSGVTTLGLIRARGLGNVARDEAGLNFVFRCSMTVSQIYDGLLH